MLNMPGAGGRGLSMLGQVALEEESGKATNGLGFTVVDRGPAELWDIATPSAARDLRRPGPAWSVPRGVGSDGARRRLRRQLDRKATAERDEDEGVERREVVRHERGRSRLLPRAGGRGRGAGSVHRRAVAARAEDREDACVPPRPLPRPSPGDHAHQRARSRREPHSGRWRGGRTRVVPRRAPLHRAAAGRAQRSRPSWRASMRSSERPSVRRSPSTRASPSS